MHGSKRSELKPRSDQQGRLKNGEMFTPGLFISTSLESDAHLYRRHSPPDVPPVVVVVVLVLVSCLVVVVRDSLIIRVLMFLK